MRVGVYHPDLSRLGTHRFLPRRIGVTLLIMFLVVFGMRLLEVMFFVGIVGSAVVVLITSFEDMHELFGKTEEASAGEKTPDA
jgi:hypothetical protein